MGVAIKQKELVNLKVEDSEIDVIHKYLIEKMSIYLAKMSMHDLNLATRTPSLIAVAAIYVALKICEQLTKRDLINSSVVTNLINQSKLEENDILDAS
jgi:hypothetical protein